MIESLGSPNVQEVVGSLNDAEAARTVTENAGLDILADQREDYCGKPLEGGWCTQGDVLLPDQLSAARFVGRVSADSQVTTPYLRVPPQVLPEASHDRNSVRKYQASMKVPLASKLQSK